MSDDPETHGDVVSDGNLIVNRLSQAQLDPRTYQVRIGQLDDLEFYRVGDNGSLTWADVEARFPDALPMWDIQDGTAWLRDREPIICMGTHLAVGCGEKAPFGWALWNDETKRWLFL